MLLELLQEDGLEPKRAASTGGGEYASPCPFCGGKDRFRAWPEKGRWWCRQCGKSGDVIQYFREVRNMSFQEAKGEAVQCRGEKSFARAGSKVQCRGGKFTARATPEMENYGVNNPLWRERAEAFVSWAKHTLLENPAMLRRLAEERGLDERSIRVASLGWNPLDIRRNPRDWGLPDRKRPMFIPRGLVIPVWHGGVLNRVKTRDDSRKPKYLTLAGGGSAPMSFLMGCPCVMIVESELDALLLWQEAGDYFTVVGLGSCTARPDPATLALLRKASLILDCLDADDAGAAQGWRWWRERFPASWVRWPCVSGKDPNAMRLAGESVREWALAGLECHKRTSHAS